MQQWDNPQLLHETSAQVLSCACECSVLDAALGLVVGMKGKDG